MKKSEVVDLVFRQQIPAYPKQEAGLAFAPTNIALCKYWGKRDDEINLPTTSSLSIALPDKGAMTKIKSHHQDIIILNGEEVAQNTEFAKRIFDFLNLFRRNNAWHLKIEISMNIPVAAGLASSACGFASLTAALNDLFAWNLPQRSLSILARLGSGSAARSFWLGFVEWHAGAQADGMDSYAEPINAEWPEFYVGLLTLSDEQKPISSREAMRRSVDTCTAYASWPKKSARDMITMRQALQTKKFSLLGGTAESNALAMHCTMLSSWPPVCYYLPETIAAMHKVWDLRKQGLELFFTQDAGPNLKLLFLEKDKPTIQQHFPEMEAVKLFV